MKLKALLLALLATLVVASGAAAKNGGGNGQGQAKHSQSAQTKHSSQGSKHEAKAHKAKEAKVKKPKKHAAPATEETGDESAPADTVATDELSAEGKNPAWTCRALIEERGALQFVADFGTNANGANAFGKCVSGVAHGDDEATAEAPAESGDQCEAVAPPVVEPTVVEATDDTESSDEPEDAGCEAGDGTETTVPPPADGTSSTGDTDGTETGTVVDPAVPTADEALLAAARAVEAFAASL